MSNRTLMRLYAAVIFLSAAMLLVLEIVAGRLLAPYIGVSLYTWTSIIGIILAGLSLGHWIGGIMADRSAGHRAVGIVLLVASIASLAILPLLLLAGSVIQQQQLGLLSASFAYVLVLFFIPAAALGVVSPLLTTMALGLDQRAGSVVGRMHALSALGSITGTFVTGYWLVQWVGTRTIVVAVAGCLFLTALPFLLGRNRHLPVVIIGLFIAITVALVTGARHGFASPCEVESNYYCLRVVEESATSESVSARTLVLDHMVHSTNVRDNPAQLWTPYIHAMDTLIHHHFKSPESLSYLFAGGGAYTHPRALKFRYPDVGITVSEIDPAVTQIAEQQLYLNTEGMRIMHGDIRNSLQQLPDSTFDVVVTDVFHDVGIPHHLTTLEFADLVSEKLTLDGLYLINVIDAFPANRLIQSLVFTLEQRFGYVGVWIEAPPNQDTRLTYVLSASMQPLNAESISSTSGVSRQWFNIADFIKQQSDRDAPVLLTDNYAPVDRLLKQILTTRAGL